MLYFFEIVCSRPICEQDLIQQSGWFSWHWWNG